MWVQRTLVMYALRYYRESELPFFPLHATIMDIEIMLMSGDGICNSVSVETSGYSFYAVSAHKHIIYERNNFIKTHTKNIFI